jgi:hypothetical protein
MDFLDPKKELHHRIIMMVGYVLITLAILIGTTILLYQANGFGLGKGGTVVQSGLVFLSSQPNPAQITINGQLNSASTNARLLLQAGVYNVTLHRNGYRNWERTIVVNGDTVIHYDYPLLFPTKLITTKLSSYSSIPPLATQSPDRRWLLVQQPGSDSVFYEYDLSNPNPKPTTLTLPSSLASKASTSDAWQLVAWADDNQHVVLQHTFDGKTEFILLDRINPQDSVNLNTALNTNSIQLTLNNNKYSQYYLYDPTTQTLETDTLNSAPVPYLQHVLAYKSYGSNTMLYVTDTNAPAGKVLLKLEVGSQTYIIHSFPVGSAYVLNLTQYDGTLYVAAGASVQNKVYVFRDPVGQLNNQPQHAVVPIQVLHVSQPNDVEFSNNTQFIMAENGTQFGVYDIENKVGYNYTSNLPMDAPQQHAFWMDGDRLAYVSNGKLVVFDYDHTNVQTLNAMSPAFIPFFDTNYRYLYGLTADTSNGQYNLTQTSLLIPADQ